MAITSPNLFMTSSTFFEHDSGLINTTQLFIASTLYPSLNTLTAKHIAAIRINTPLDRLVDSSEAKIHSNAIDEQTSIMIRQAEAYGTYYNSLTPT